MQKKTVWHELENLKFDIAIFFNQSLVAAKRVIFFFCTNTNVEIWSLTKIGQPIPNKPNLSKLKSLNWLKICVIILASYYGVVFIHYLIAVWHLVKLNTIFSTKWNLKLWYFTYWTNNKTLFLFSQKELRN